MSAKVLVCRSSRPSLFNVALFAFAACLLGRGPVLPAQPVQIGTISPDVHTGCVHEGKVLNATSMVNGGLTRLSSATRLFVVSGRAYTHTAIRAAGYIYTVTRSGLVSCDGDGGPEIRADLNHLTIIAMDGTGNVFEKESVR